MRKKIVFGVLFLAVALASSSVWAASRTDLKKAETLNNLAIAKVRAGDLDGAEVDLLAALEYSGQNPKLKKNLGGVYFEKGVRATRAGNFYDAQRNLSKALETDPEEVRYREAYAKALSIEADSRAKTGQNEDALGLYKKAAEKDPGNITAWIQAADYAWKTQKLDLARDYLDRAKALDAKNKNVLILEEKMAKSDVETGFDSQTSLQFILSTHPEGAGIKSDGSILADLEKAYDEVSYQLNFFPQNKISVVFYPAGEFHDHWKLPARVNGYYDGKLRIPYAADATFDQMKPMIKHELTHAFVSAMAHKPIPQWMNEGLAQWVEGREMDRKSKDALMMMQVTKRVPDIAHLDAAFLGQHNPLNSTGITLAYMKAFSLTQYLIQEHGVWSLTQFAQNTDSSLSSDELFKKYFQSTPEEIEKNWAEWLARQKSNYVFN